MPVNSTQWKLANTCRTGLRVQPKRGDAILFYNQRPAGATEPLAKHGACPLIEGIKWGANLWVWNNIAWSPNREPGYYDEDSDEFDPLARSADFLNEYDQDLEILWQQSPGNLISLGIV